MKYLMHRFTFLIFYCLICQSPLVFAGNDSLINVKSQQEVDEISLENLTNCYRINDLLYRSEQPNHDAMVELQNIGIVSVLNLRNIRSDKQEIRGTNLVALHCPINTWTISYDDIVAGLLMLRNSAKPTVVHCLHGSDRTGCIVAAYRMVYDGWSREDAIAEFTDPRFGYHDGWFPNILELLNDLDLDKLKADLQFDTVPFSSAGR